MTDTDQSSAYFNLGAYSRHITTESAQAVLWFNRGLIWCYGFNHEEGVRCFNQALKHDPQCAMAYWGIAYASGPFYNKPWEWFGDKEREQAVALCFENAQKALALSDNVSKVEQSLIHALANRYRNDHFVSDEEFVDWNDIYADYMREVYAAFPQDLDVITLSAESLMNRTPWQLWDLHKGTPKEDADTVEAIDILESGLEYVKNNNLGPHPGILHFYLHAIEMSPFPEKALPAADQLRFSAPESGHLLHMPTHIDVLCGRYAEAVAANNRAIAADKKYIELRGASEFYMISCVHNCHLKMYAAMFLGQFEAAMEAADRIREIIPEEMLQIDRPYLATTLEGCYSMKAHVQVRFGRWQHLVDEPLLDDPELYLITNIMLQYAKGIAHAALGDVESAQNYQRAFTRDLGKVPDWHILSNNPTVDILGVAGEMLNGEIEYRKGNHDRAFDHLRKAAYICDNLKFSEPWPWMHPPRHALGALLLEQNRVEEALQIYIKDLGLNNELPRCSHHPNNVWALHGYTECLKRTGELAQAKAVQNKLDDALELADSNITASCCCRRGA